MGEGFKQTPSAEEGAGKKPGVEGQEDAAGQEVQEQHEALERNLVTLDELRERYPEKFKQIAFRYEAAFERYNSAFKKSVSAVEIIAGSTLVALYASLAEQGMADLKSAGIILGGGLFAIAFGAALEVHGRVMAKREEAKLNEEYGVGPFSKKV